MTRVYYMGAGGTIPPPTVPQLKRIKELKDHPAFATGANLDYIYDALMVKKMTRNREQAGILIYEMKKKVEEYEKSRRE